MSNAPRGRPFTGKDDARNNLRGRPPKPDLLTTLKSLPDGVKRELFTCKITGVPVTVEEFAAIALACLVGEGDVQATKYLNDHIHGKPADHVEIDGAGALRIIEELVSVDGNNPATQSPD